MSQLYSLGSTTGGSTEISAAGIAGVSSSSTAAQAAKDARAQADARKRADDARPRTLVAQRGRFEGCRLAVRTERSLRPLGSARARANISLEVVRK